MSQTPRASW